MSWLAGLRGFCGIIRHFERSGLIRIGQELGCEILSAANRRIQNRLRCDRKRE